MSTLALFRNAGDTRAFAPGETIFVEGDDGRQMYVVLEGSVRLSVTGRTLEKVGKGGVFEVHSSTPHPAAPRPRLSPPARWRRSPRSASRTRKENPDFALEIMRIMAVRLRSMDHRL